MSRLFPKLEELTLSGVDIAGATGAPLEACTRPPSLALPRLPRPGSPSLARAGLSKRPPNL